MKVFIVGGDMLVARMFLKNGHEVVEDIQDSELLCFTGGADVNPVYYGDIKHRTTHYNDARDQEEMRIFNKFYGMPKVGICRGSQFLNVMSGGKLWQDVDKHAIGGTHNLKYLPQGSYNYNWDHDEDRDPNVDYVVVPVTSTHHQMMIPDKGTAELWGYANISRYRDRGQHDKRRSDFGYSPDVEIVYYKDTNCLCFQPHPEYGVKSCEDLFFQCLERAFPAEMAVKAAA